jgi:hypothetical protein
MIEIDIEIEMGIEKAGNLIRGIWGTFGSWRFWFFRLFDFIFVFCFVYWPL